MLFQDLKAKWGRVRDAGYRKYICLGIGITGLNENLGRDGKVEKLYWEPLETLISSIVASRLFVFAFLCCQFNGAFIRVMLSLRHKLFTKKVIFYFFYFRERQAIMGAAGNK